MLVTCVSACITQFWNYFPNLSRVFEGRFTVPAFAAYSMSKKACIAFSDGLRQEMAKFGVKVITIEPGLYR